MLKSKLPYWMYKAQILFKSNYLDPKIVINWLSAKMVPQHQNILIKHQSNDWITFTATFKSNNMQMIDKQFVGLTINLRDVNIVGYDKSNILHSSIEWDCGCRLNKFLFLKILV